MLLPHRRLFDFQKKRDHQQARRGGTEHAVGGSKRAVCVAFPSSYSSLTRLPACLTPPFPFATGGAWDDEALTGCGGSGYSVLHTRERERVDRARDISQKAVYQARLVYNRIQVVPPRPIGRGMAARKGAKRMPLHRHAHTRIRIHTRNTSDGHGI